MSPGVLENSQDSWVGGCFDCFTARFHYDYGSWKMLVAQTEKKNKINKIEFRAKTVQNRFIFRVSL